LQTQEQTQGDGSGGNDTAELMFTALITTEPFVFGGNSQTADGSSSNNDSNTQVKMSKMCLIFSLNKCWKFKICHT